MNLLDKKHPTVVIGPPGTGKTTFILDKIEEHLANDISIDKIAFFSFSMFEEVLDSFLQGLH